MEHFNFKYVHTSQFQKALSLHTRIERSHFAIRKVDSLRFCQLCLVQLLVLGGGGKYVGFLSLLGGGGQQ